MFLRDKQSAKRGVVRYRGVLVYRSVPMNDLVPRRWIEEDEEEGEEEGDDMNVSDEDRR